jgi:hypothetical protein
VVALNAGIAADGQSDRGHRTVAAPPSTPTRTAMVSLVKPTIAPSSSAGPGEPAVGHRHGPHPDGRYVTYNRTGTDPDGACRNCCGNDRQTHAWC